MELRSLRERNKDAVQKWQRTNPEAKVASARRSALRRYFSITPEQYNLTLTMQKGVCAICKNTETAKALSGRARHLSVDHNHSTGKIRGLLCANCNRLVGIRENTSFVEIDAYIKIYE